MIILLLLVLLIEHLSRRNMVRRSQQNSPVEQSSLGFMRRKKPSNACLVMPMSASCGVQRGLEEGVGSLNAIGMQSEVESLPLPKPMEPALKDGRKESQPTTSTYAQDMDNLAMALSRIQLEADLLRARWRKAMQCQQQKKPWKKPCVEPVIVGIAHRKLDVCLLDLDVPNRSPTMSFGAHQGCQERARRKLRMKF